MPGLRRRGTFGLQPLIKWGRLVFGAAIVVVSTWLFGSAAVWYARTVGLFDLRQIEVRGTQVLTRADVVEAMALPLTMSLRDIDMPALLERVEALNYVHGVRLGRRFPHTLFADIVENQCLAYVTGPESFVITAEGKALPLPHGRFELELPTVSSVKAAMSALDQGAVWSHPQLQEALEILTHLSSSFPHLYGELSELVFEDQGVTLYMAETSTTVHLGSQDLERRIATLDAFLRTVAGTRTISDYALIDLRYERQVVVKERA